MVKVRWESEKLYLEGDAYFDAVHAAISNAKRSVDIEMYIFANDPIGVRMIEALCGAARRGVRVRVMVDAVGAPLWEYHFGSIVTQAGVRYKIYRRLLHSFFRKLNKRNHRKLVLIDGELAFVGSRNFTRCHSEALAGDKAWRDVSIAVTGIAIADLRNAFEAAWRSFGSGLSRRIRTLKSPFLYPDLVRLNMTMRQRRKNYIMLKNQIRRAENRLWITTGYFVPTRSVVRLLSNAAIRGVDVRIIVTTETDVFFMPWVAAAFFHSLKKAGIRIFQFKPSVLHSKTMIADDVMIVGSSNFNHRSIFHDLEADVYLSLEPTKQTLERNAFEDIAKSEEVGSHSVGFLIMLLGRILLLFRSFL